MQENIKGIYVDLDSIFDTRLGTLAEINPELIKVVFDEKYLFRKSDDFSVIKKETFKSLYDLRNFDTLKLSPYTAVFEVINNIIKKLLEMAVGTPEISGAKLYVNLYPFVVPPEFAGDLLELMVERTGKLIEIEIIDVPPKELTFSYCNRFFDFLIIYDYNAFLETNILNGQHSKNNMSDRTLISPELYYKNFSIDELNSMSKKSKTLRGKTPSEILKMVSSPAIILELVEPVFFSTDINLYATDFYSADITESIKKNRRDAKEETAKPVEEKEPDPKPTPVVVNKVSAISDDDFAT